MEATVVKTGTEGKTWGGGNEPLKASYGKMMMWFFIVSDSLTFAGFLSSYGMSRFKFIDAWPIADEVFTHFPFLHGVEAPMYYVAFMTFILIFSSVTMVLAVDAGHKMQQKKVIFYLFLTIIGGLIFLGSQAWEWNTFIKGDYGAVETHGGQIIQFLDKDGDRVALADFAAVDNGARVEQTKQLGVWYQQESEYLPTVSFEQVKEGFLANDNLLIRLPYKDEHGKHIVLGREESITKLVNDGNLVVEGANLRHNEYGHPLFADFFFFITGFHGFHVSIGVLLNIIVFFNVIIGTYERRGHYEMVEKVGLYWHFVDLVWVFVFTFFYLV
ncbi:MULTISPECIES: cytochrome c oxidase subunit 3 [Aequorivita]|jgi:cytochrome c oxidase subunit 3|uniref:Cytochrome c oxidase subunit 3 n=2 Tax=Aequorivita TaxID=153265 RepID=A0AB35YR80_9FLAO|nr:cytochrome c oxidase subunit 3 [Aequorivita sp. Ant34-E75]WGF93812.1 cytochrome c oxidase subunit 3 [Aequorivita sp. Ant34-E75]